MTTPRRNPLLVLGLLACVMQCQSGRTAPSGWPPGPVDSLAEFRDDVPEPAPAPTPEPSAELTVEIILPDKLPAGEFIPFKLRHNGSLANLSYLVDWKPAGNHLIATSEGGHVTHVPGPHTLTVFGAIDGTAVLHSAPFVIEGTAPAPTPGPGPQPPAPAVTLASLVPDEKAREQLATFYGDLASSVKAGLFTTVAHFRAGQQMAIKTAQAQGNLPKGLAAINAPIQERLDKAVVSEGPLDVGKTAAIVAALESIAADFGG